MNYRQIETSREIRQWIKQAVILTGIIAAIPEARHAVVNAVAKVKNKITRNK